MKYDKLMIISGYTSLLPVIKDCCKTLNIEPIIFDWEQADTSLIKTLHDYFHKNGEPEVIISRGAVADIIQNSFPNIVLIRAEPDDMDIMESLDIAKSYGKNLGILLYEGDNRTFRPDSIKRILDLERLDVYLFHSRSDIEKSIFKGKKNGLDAMVGGGTLGVKTGYKIGIPVLFAETGKRSLERALRQGVSIIQYRQKEQLQLETFSTTTDLVSEGILIIEKNEVILANDVMLKILNRDANDFLYRPLESICPEIITKELLKFFSDILISEKVLSINNKNYHIKKKGDMEERLTIVFRNADDIRRQEQHIRFALKNKGLSAKFTFEDIIGKSNAIVLAKKKAAYYAATNANIFIFGESGTGKELFAQSIHNASERRLNPFVAVNCAAIPESLIESELFGYEEGAFSGAKRGGHAGLFELSHGGTLFLDEIDSIPINVQGALLRAIQEKEIRRVGSMQSLSVDIRIISASNRNIIEMINSNKFRIDLYYRLNVLNLTIPSLNNRKDDIIPLAQHFLEKYSKKYNKTLPDFTLEDKSLMLQSIWRGNVRSLENVIHRYVALQGEMAFSIKDCLTEESLKQIQNIKLTTVNSEKGRDENLISVHRSSLEKMENEIINSVLQLNNGNKLSASEELGISRTTLWKKLKKEQQ